jgi:hypothetical protein
MLQHPLVSLSLSFSPHKHTSSLVITSLLFVMLKSTSLCHSFLSYFSLSSQRYLMERLFNERWNEISLMTTMGVSRIYFKRGWIDIDASVSFFFVLRIFSCAKISFIISAFYMISYTHICHPPCHLDATMGKLLWRQRILWRRIWKILKIRLSGSKVVFVARQYGRNINKSNIILTQTPWHQ